jgi:hypothetical protein
MLRVPKNLVHAGEQLDRTLYSVAPEPSPIGVKQRVIGPVVIVCSLGLMDTWRYFSQNKDFNNHRYL